VSTVQCSNDEVTQNPMDILQTSPLLVLHSIKQFEKQCMLLDLNTLDRTHKDATN